MSRQQHYADSLLQALDKSQIPTHILYDRVVGLAALDVFNLVYNNPDTSNVRHFLQAYYELHAASYANPHTDPCRQVLADNARHYRLQNIILVGALRYRFNYIDSNAVRNNQLRWDTQALSKLYDVPGRSASPYLLREVAVAAALADSTRSGSVSFRLDPASIFSNAGSALTSASIDFGDGSGLHTCTPGQTVQISYASAGLKTLHYVLSYADGNQFTTYSNLYVSRASATYRTMAGEPVPACRNEMLTSSIPFQRIAGQSRISYYYSSSKGCDPVNNTAQSITKPIIIVDGIDYDGTRMGENIYGEYLYYVDGNNAEQNLGAELRRQGYDVVILDFPNVELPIQIGSFTYYVTVRHSGADYMERNAYTLVTLIQQLNQQLQTAGSTEKITVIGPSMGGQIARYALAYMEHNNLPHNTSLYLSLDSPHNGANIPIGLQHFVDFFASNGGNQQVLDGLSELDSPAARELTQHHHSQGTPFAPDPLRTQFLSDLSSFGGYPSQLRRVAVTNGALDATPQRDQNGQVLLAGQQAFGLEQRGVPQGTAGTVVQLLFPIGLIARAITLASAQVYYEPDYGQTNNVLHAYYVLNGGHWQEATGPAGSCGLDGAAGGFRYFFSSVTDNQNSTGVFQMRHFYSMRDKACFIPTRSGLGYTQSADNCQAVDSDLVCTGTTPFDAYYGPTGHNEEHIQLTPANVEFIRNEILKITPKPVFQTAPLALCPNSSPTTYSVKAECVAASRGGYTPPGTTYSWTPGSGLALVSGQGTASVQIQPASGFTGTSTVQVVATRTGYTASAPVSLTVHVTRGELTLDYYRGVRLANSAQQSVADELAIESAQGPGTNTTCPAQLVQLQFTGFNAVAPYTLVRTNYSNQQPTSTTTTTLNGNSGNRFSVSVGRVDFSVKVTGTSLCDGQPVTSNELFFEAQPCPQQLAAYPNPADATLHLVPAEGTAMEAKAITATLYNSQGQEVRRVSAATELDTSTLPTGLYYLVTEQHGQAERYQIRVQH